MHRRIFQQWNSLKMTVTLRIVWMLVTIKLFDVCIIHKCVYILKATIWKTISQQLWTMHVWLNLFLSFFRILFRLLRHIHSNRYIQWKTCHLMRSSSCFRNFLGSLICRGNSIMFAPMDASATPNILYHIIYRIASKMNWELLWVKRRQLSQCNTIQVIF